MSADKVVVSNPSVDIKDWGSTEQAIGRWLDNALNALTLNMTDVGVNKDGNGDVTLPGQTDKSSPKSISGKSLSKEDLASIEKAATRNGGGGTGLYTKTHKGEWVATHSMEGMLVTANANQEISRGTDVLTKGIEEKSKSRGKAQKAIQTAGQYV